MQPYFLPYLGYFHLLAAVDTFVIYDDIEYTKKGWINRNRLFFGEKVEYIKLPLVKDSDYLTIDQRAISPDWSKEKLKHKRKLEQFYGRRKNFTLGMELFEEIGSYEDLNLFKFIHHSVLKVSQQINISTEIVKSSSVGNFSSLKGKEKVKAICKSLGADSYVNVISGIDLYDKDDFMAVGLDLKFVKSSLAPYDQLTNGFVPGLSVLDMIFSINDTDEMQQQLQNYELV